MKVLPQTHADHPYGIIYDILRNSIQCKPLSECKNDSHLVWEGTRKEAFLFLKSLQIPFTQFNKTKVCK